MTAWSKLEKFNKYAYDFLYISFLTLLLASRSTEATSSFYSPRHRTPTWNSSPSPRDAWDASHATASAES